MAESEARVPTGNKVSQRYQLLLPIASGGMASVYVGRIRGAAGFSRIVAIKRALPEIAADPDASRMFVDEARLAAKIHHPNIVAVHDVEDLDGELWLVMDYVQGVSLTQLIRAAHGRGELLPLGVAMRVAVDAAAGLHAAHELTDELGRPLGLVHRDVSPQNILVGADGTTRLTDFGIAKSKRPRLSRKTVQGILKGKTAYMAPEYVQEQAIDARADIFALGVVAWEALANEPLFRGQSDVETIHNVLTREAPRLAPRASVLDDEVDRVLARALEKKPENRWPTAQSFGRALEAAARGCGLFHDASEVASCVRELAGKTLAARQQSLRRLLESDEARAGEDTATIKRPAHDAGAHAAEQRTATIAGQAELAEQLALEAPTVVRPASPALADARPMAPTSPDTPRPTQPTSPSAPHTEEPLAREIDRGTDEVTTHQLPVDEPSRAVADRRRPLWLLGAVAAVVAGAFVAVTLWPRPTSVPTAEPGPTAAAEGARLPVEQGEGGREPRPRQPEEEAVASTANPSTANASGEPPKMTTSAPSSSEPPAATSTHAAAPSSNTPVAAATTASTSTSTGSRPVATSSATASSRYGANPY